MSLGFPTSSPSLRSCCFLSTARRAYPRIMIAYYAATATFGSCGQRPGLEQASSRDGGADLERTTAGRQLGQSVMNVRHLDSLHSEERGESTTRSSAVLCYFASIRLAPKMATPRTVPTLRSQQNRGRRGSGGSDRSRREHPSWLASIGGHPRTRRTEAGPVPPRKRRQTKNALNVANGASGSRPRRHVTSARPAARNTRANAGDPGLTTNGKATTFVELGWRPPSSCDGGVPEGAQVHHSSLRSHTQP
jgi:hypothetical protein